MQKRCIRILGVLQTAFIGARNAMPMSKCCFLMFLLAYPPLAAALLCCSFKIFQKKKRTMQRKSCLRQNWNQAVHTECIFCTLCLLNSNIIWILIIFKCKIRMEFFSHFDSPTNNKLKHTSRNWSDDIFQGICPFFYLNRYCE